MHKPQAARDKDVVPTGLYCCNAISAGLFFNHVSREYGWYRADEELRPAHRSRYGLPIGFAVPALSSWSLLEGFLHDCSCATLRMSFNSAQGRMSFNSAQGRITMSPEGFPAFQLKFICYRVPDDRLKALSSAIAHRLKQWSGSIGVLRMVSRVGLR